ncbi:flavin reductase family protein [Streptococcus sp. X16XC17]|uniref:flavin reductase family protein n=1 Tax=unclassified Streptococcus TaxID=2608887 RepID=UPI00066FC0C8|nr:MULTISPECIES: flavin reductase family protein [unclassified Streptococcus]TCD46304.1 flavin reductase family protein [Streptococcus sp. X16XC17]
MISMDQSALTKQEMYKIMIGTVIPRPIALVATLGEQGRLSGPFSFSNIVSYKPPLTSISIQRKNGQLKDTTANILRTKEAVVHSVSKSILKSVNETARELAPDESELNYTDFDLMMSETMKTPGILQALARFETILHQHIPIQDEEGQIVADLLLLKIQHLHLSETVYQNSYILADQLEPMSRLAGNDYAELGEKTTMERPK